MEQQRDTTFSQTTVICLLIISPSICIRTVPQNRFIGKLEHVSIASTFTFVLFYMVLGFSLLQIEFKH